MSETIINENKLYPLYPLDPEAPFTVQIVFLPDLETTIFLSHSLAKPTKEQWLQRENRLSVRMTKADGRRDKIEAGTIEADGFLYDAIARKVKGYQFAADDDPDEWVELNTDIVRVIPSEHKHAALNALTGSKCTLERAEQRGFALFPSVLRVVEVFGNFAVIHCWVKPTEAARRAYDKKATDIFVGRDAKQELREVSTNLSAAIKFYDDHFRGIEGVTLKDELYSEERRDAFLAAISADSKRKVADAVMASFNAMLSE